MVIEFVATCLFGLEHFLGEEIDRLGYRRTETIDGRVSFIGDEAAIARCNIHLRCAERVYIKMGSFRARTFGELFEGTKAIEWERFIGREDAFPVKGHAVKSKLFSIPDCQSIVKKAIAKRLDNEYGMCWFPESKTKYQVEFFILKDVATLMIDTSGVPLHKRGYRAIAGAAPLRETLAAALVDIAGYRGRGDFCDPFCGSGTVLIEGAMLAHNIAPGLNREFAAQNWDIIPEGIWKSEKERCRDFVKTDTDFVAFGSDIDDHALALTHINAKRVGMHKFLRLSNADIADFNPQTENGTLVTNPPYGERMLDIKEAERLYKIMGEKFAPRHGWSYGIISPDEEFEKCFGRRADKRRKLYNGMIKCQYYMYFK